MSGQRESSSAGFQQLTHLIPVKKEKNIKSTCKNHMRVEEFTSAVRRRLAGIVRTHEYS